MAPALAVLLAAAAGFGLGSGVTWVLVRQEGPYGERRSRYRQAVKLLDRAAKASDQPGLSRDLTGIAAKLLDESAPPSEGRRFR